MAEISNKTADLHYLYKHLSTRVVSIVVDSSRRNRDLYPRSDTFRITFDEPFTNVANIAVRDTYIPNPITIINKYNDSVTFRIGLGLQRRSIQRTINMSHRDYTPNSFVRAIKEEDAKVRNYNIVTIMAKYGIDVVRRGVIDDFNSDINHLSFSSRIPFCIVGGESTASRVLGIATSGSFRGDPRHADFDSDDHGYFAHYPHDNHTLYSIGTNNYDVEYRDPPTSPTQNTYSPNSIYATDSHYDLVSDGYDVTYVINKETKTINRGIALDYVSVDYNKTTPTGMLFPYNSAATHARVKDVGNVKSFALSAYNTSAPAWASYNRSATTGTVNMVAIKPGSDNVFSLDISPPTAYPGGRYLGLHFLPPRNNSAGQLIETSYRAGLEQAVILDKMVFPLPSTASMPADVLEQYQMVDYMDHESLSSVVDTLRWEIYDLTESRDKKSPIFYSPLSPTTGNIGDYDDTDSFANDGTFEFGEQFTFVDEVHSDRRILSGSFRIGTHMAISGGNNALVNDMLGGCLEMVIVDKTGLSVTANLADYIGHAVGWVNYSDGNSASSTVTDIDTTQYNSMRRIMIRIINTSTKSVLLHSACGKDDLYPELLTSGHNLGTAFPGYAPSYDHPLPSYVVPAGNTMNGLRTPTQYAFSTLGMVTYDRDGKKVETTYNGGASTLPFCLPGLLVHMTIHRHQLITASSGATEFHPNFDGRTHLMVGHDLVNMIPSKYIVLHCPDVEKLVRDFSYTAAEAATPDTGLALMPIKFVSKVYSEQHQVDKSVEQVISGVQKFHPISKLNSLEFYFVDDGARRVEFKGLDFYFILNITYYAPDTDPVFDTPLEKINPMYGDLISDTMVKPSIGFTPHDVEENNELQLAIDKLERNYMRVTRDTPSGSTNPEYKAMPNLI